MPEINQNLFLILCFAIFCFIFGMIFSFVSYSRIALMCVFTVFIFCGIILVLFARFVIGRDLGSYKKMLRDSWIFMVLLILTLILIFILYIYPE